MARDLTSACLAADLLYQVADLGDTGCAHRVPLGFQPAAGIDGPLARPRGVPFKRIRTAFSTARKAKVLSGDDFRDRKAVVQFGELDVARRDARHPVSLLAGTPDRGKRGDG